MPNPASRRYELIDWSGHQTSCGCGERVSDGWRRDLPAMALCEVDGLAAGEGGELAGEDKGEAEETVGRLWLGDGLGAGRAGTSGFGGLCSNLTVFPKSTGW